MEYAALHGCNLLDARGGVIALPRQARRLLAFLVTRPNRSASIEECIDALWGDDLPSSARATVHMFISRIRKAAGPEAVESNSSGYRVAFDLDVDRFFSTVLDAEQRRSEDPAGAAALVDAARATGNADAFDEFADDAWLQPAIASFAERRRTAEELWSALRVETGTATEVIDRLDAAAVREPLREIRWEHLMVALYRASRQSDSLAAYERARRHLRDSMGLEPGPGLRWAHRAVLDQMVPPESVSGPPPSARRAVVRSSVGATSSPCSADCSSTAGSSRSWEWVASARVGWRTSSFTGASWQVNGASGSRSGPAWVRRSWPGGWSPRRSPERRRRTSRWSSCASMSHAISMSSSSTRRSGRPRRPRP